jgi:hypothetical protein
MKKLERHLVSKLTGSDALPLQCNRGGKADHMEEG